MKTRQAPPQRQAARPLVAALLLLLAGCTQAPTARKLPEFPVYAPTAPFLEMQQRLKERGEAITRRNELEVRLNIINGQNKFYRDWAPLYARVRAGSRKPGP